MSSAEGTSDALPNILVTLLTELLPLKIDLEEEGGTLEVPSRLLVAQEEEVEAREEEEDAPEVASGLLVAKKGEMEAGSPVQLELLLWIKWDHCVKWEETCRCRVSALHFSRGFPQTWSRRELRSFCSIQFPPSRRP